MRRLVRLVVSLITSLVTASLVMGLDTNASFPSANVSVSIVIQYTSANTPRCSDAYTDSLSTLWAANANIKDQCGVDALQYSLYPYSGLLPTDAQLAAMVSSLACLRWFQALRLLSPSECNVGGIDFPSALETLLMASQDLVAGATPLASDQLAQFIAWRHDRNIALATGEPYDNSSDSAVAFDAQLAAATARLGDVTLTDTLQIELDGSVIGIPEPKTHKETRSTGSSDGLSDGQRIGRVAPIVGRVSVDAASSVPLATATSRVADHRVGWTMVPLSLIVVVSSLILF